MGLSFLFCVLLFLLKLSSLLPLHISFLFSSNFVDPFSRLPSPYSNHSLCTCTSLIARSRRDGGGPLISGEAESEEDGNKGKGRLESAASRALLVLGLLEGLCVFLLVLCLLQILLCLLARLCLSVTLLIVQILLQLLFLCILSSGLQILSELLALLLLLLILCLLSVCRGGRSGLRSLCVFLGLRFLLFSRLGLSRGARILRGGCCICACASRSVSRSASRSGLGLCEGCLMDLLSSNKGNLVVVVPLVRSALGGSQRVLLLAVVRSGRKGDEDKEDGKHLHF
mmetsp:Transcript_53168/g.104091  ORF Transcript_53168/g.104091 Transcript_53168/m.104091 type:complete len:284 (-) Transcript_53168:192-1043(-)